MAPGEPRDFPKAPGDLPLKPWLKWAGGKRQLLEEIRKYLPRNDGVYYEPFAGAAAVLFDLRPRKAVINDANAELMMSYRIIRDRIDDLIRALKVHRENHRLRQDYYYEVRALDRDQAAFARLSEAERAARLIYLNKTGYNGLYRVNSRGFFNVPAGRYQNPGICEEPALRAVHRYLRDNDITILAGDFTEALQNADTRSFVYFDPPYHSPAKTAFTSYQSGGFGEEEQLRLRDTFAALTERGVPCLLSNADTPFIRNLYRDFECIKVPVKRPINSRSNGRGPVGELLIRNGCPVSAGREACGVPG
jgi:DNA adenine methylase